ncbi:MAG: UDP-N-acetylmuramoyl-tripeptide--D-alanyl-D-alanine ligase [Bdellovibrionota bacterium]
MSISWSKEKLAEVIGGKLKDSTESIVFQGVEFDSREIKGGELFVALKGANTHGHDFVETALDRGAALCLVEDESYFDHPEHGNRFVCVEDSLKAFWKLAHTHREDLNIPIIAITGSAGKTTVKEMTAQLLLTQDNGGYSRKSFNNHVGVPYTLCSLGKQHKWAVLEVGMNHPGEMANLTQIIKPNIAMVIGVAPVHLAHFKNIEGIANAKCEIFEGLVDEGIALLNADDQLLLKTFDANFHNKFKLATFGTAEGNQVQLKSVASLGLQGIEFQISIAGESFKIKIPVPGEHNALNACAAILAARNLYPEISIEEISNALSKFIPPVMRMNLIHLSQNRILVDDSYNANPLSMQALLKLAQYEKSAGRKIGLILGDMLELGPSSEEFHAELAKNVASLKPEFFIAVGEYAGLMSGIVRAAGIKSFAVESPEAAAHTAIKLPFEILMIKASLGVQLARAVTVLRDKEGLN